MGTLSSYSYALLVIHFLQQRNILPNLQHTDLLRNNHQRGTHRTEEVYTLILPKHIE